VPAAAVIPAPIAYTKVVAVKKLVVEFLVVDLGPYLAVCVPGKLIFLNPQPSSGKTFLVLSYWEWDSSSFTVSKIECSKQAFFNAVEYISME
jgi:hypothetical protein